MTSIARRRTNARENPTLKQALRWAELGRPVFPTWPRQDDQCGCGDPKCKNPGKHPLAKLVPQGFKDATTDENTIRRWFRKYPKAGIAVATGSVSGIIVVDLDVGSANPRLPETRTSITPTGGLHLFYKTRARIPTNQERLGKKIDVRAEDACATLPPSHGLYEWVDPKAPIVKLPDEWVQRLQTLKRDRRYRSRADDPVMNQEIERLTFKDIEERPVEWLWENTVALNEFNTWCGEPDMGKSTAWESVAAYVTNEDTAWPDGTEKAITGEVLILTEDDPETIVRPRLRVAGAHLAKVYMVGVKHGEEFETLDSLAGDRIQLLDQALQKWPNTRLVIIDPAFEFTGDVKTNSSAEVRSKFIGPLRRLARRYHLAVIGVLQPNKSVGQSARGRVPGADAWVSASSIAFMFGEHPKEEGLYVMAPVRNKLSKEKRALVYEIRDDGGHPKTVWHENRTAVSAEELVQPPTTKVEHCVVWLQNHLDDGPKPMRKVQEQAKKHGFKNWVLREAKKKLGVNAVKEGLGAWLWSLPK